MVTALNSAFMSGLFASGSGGTAGSGTARTKVAPTAPWTRPPSAAELSAAAKAALNGRRYINEGAAQLDLPGASADYRKLFALYQGLTTLNSVVEAAGGKGVTSLDALRYERAFARGMKEVSDYVAATKLENVRLVRGDVAASAKSLAVARAKTEYVTPPLVSASADVAVDAFQGDVKFTMSVKRVNVLHNVAIDLADMGAQTRSIANVVKFINQKLEAEGVDTRVSTQRTAGQPRTVQVAGKTITLGPGADQWALKIKVSIGETVSFSAPSTQPAVYLAQQAGDPDPDGKASTDDAVIRQQLLKFQTDSSLAVPLPPQKDGEANWVEGRVFSQTLGPEVDAVRATQVGADGSIYMLADVTSKIEGQAIRGEQDVALLKYDPAGKLVYARTLGASDTAKGLSLALSADGKIAIAGSVTGALNSDPGGSKGAPYGPVDGPMNSGATGAFASYSDSFVTVFDADGQEMWTQRRGARQNDEASEVAFGADGTVYVAGRSQTGMPGAAAVGGWDSYIEAFKKGADGKVKTLFTQTFGTTAADRPSGMVVDGTSLVTASIEDGHAVLRRFDVSGASPVLTSTRDLGDLQGGDLAGLALDGGDVVLAGSTTNAALSAGGVTHGHAGGTDAFVARIPANLGPGGEIAYYGGAGDDRATAVTVSNGQVYLAGSAGTDLPDHPGAVGKTDGFLARIDTADGSVDWSQRFTGKDGRAAPTSIAVDPTGSSVLDRIGLPKGEIDLTDSQRLTAVSSLRGGDQFTVRVGQGAAKTVTIEDAETLDTLAQKIRRATGFQAKVTFSTVAGQRTLTVAPVNPRYAIEFGAGKTDKDALEFLGIPEGVVRATTLVDGKTAPADGKAQMYGLSLPSDLNLADDQQRHHALSEITQALGVIRQAYKDLVAAASPKTAQAAAASAATGPVPAYLTSQISNYQAALARLTGGG